MLSVCDTSFCYSCSSQHSGNLEIQPPGREEPREPGFIPSETLTPAEAGTGSTELWQCAAAWHLHLLCCSWDKTLTLQPSLPPNTQATSTASSTHGLGAEAKKDPNSWCGMKCYIANAHLCIEQQSHTAVSGASPGEEPHPQAGGDVLCKCFWHLHSSVQPQRPHVPSRLTLGHGSRSKALACHQPPLPMLAQEEPTL